MPNAHNMPRERQPFYRKMEFKPIIEHVIMRLALQVDLALTVCPEEMLSNRKELSAMLQDEIYTTSQQYVKYLLGCWEAEWERQMGGRFVDAPGLQN